jgi:hypothetical protein
MTERGRQKDVKVTMPEGIDPALSQTMSQSMEQLNDLGVRFLPEEAVGVGARWEIKDRPTANGMTVDQTVTYTLKSRDKDRLVLALDFVQSAKPQKIINAAAPGMEMDLVSLASKGVGSMDYDLARLLPAKASITFEMSMEMKVGLGEEAQAMKVDMTVELGLTGEVVPATTPAAADPK